VGEALRALEAILGFVDRQPPFVVLLGDIGIPEGSVTSLVPAEETADADGEARGLAPLSTSTSATSSILF